MTDIHVDPQEVQSAKTLCIIGYFGILFLVPLFGARDNKFAQYHANQSLLNFILGLIGGVVSRFTFIGVIISLVISVICFVLMIIGIINVVHEEAKPLPLIGNFTLIQSY